VNTISASLSVAEPAAPAKHTFRAADGFEIAYWVDDFTDPWIEPETLLLLHAAMGSSRRWFRWVPRLARRFRVVRMDLRGHGHSQKPRPEEPFSLDQLVGDAARLIDILGCGGAHVVGNSAGGYVAQQLAIRQPEKVKTLALYGATPGLKNSHAATWIPRIQEIGLKQFLADTIHERFDDQADPQLVRWFIEQAGSNDPAFIGRFVLHMCTHDFMEELRAIRCPTLIVAAGKEPIGDGSAYRKMHERIAGSKLLQYDVASHNIGDQYADRCTDDLLRFLEQNT
jgi:pimeloyl-ACP methyl ester carboxylesterase